LLGVSVLPERRVDEDLEIFYHVPWSLWRRENYPDS
jgi:hypothetical protein